MRILILFTLLFACPSIALSAPDAKAQTPARGSTAADTLRAHSANLNLDLENATVREALKQIFDQAQQEYVIDEDVPDTTRTTLRARNVKLFTALDLVTQAAGVSWNQEVRNGKPVFRIGTGSNLGLGYRTFFVPQRQQIQGAGLVTTFEPVNIPTGPKSLSELPVIGRLFRSTGAPYAWSMMEQRSTFTCPHCQGKATVVGPRQQPKCPKCERTFQADWRFCPADGTPRPPAPGEWRFCPMCGKAVQMEPAGAANRPNEDSALNRRSPVK
jgi:hypothetical protein